MSWLMVVCVILISECHSASWWVSTLCYSGKISITSPSWHRSGWDNTRCAMHNRNAQFNQGYFKFNQRQGLSLISGSRFMHNGSRTWVGFGGVHGNCFLNIQFPYITLSFQCLTVERKGSLVLMCQPIHHFVQCYIGITSCHGYIKQRNRLYCIYNWIE